MILREARRVLILPIPAAIIVLAGALPARSAPSCGVMGRSGCGAFVIIGASIELRPPGSFDQCGMMGGTMRDGTTCIGASGDRLPVN
jgi:hypothetical protein